MNIYDISRLAGVSIATVSRVLNGSDKVSDATRQKVLDIMERNGYTPNAFARLPGSRQNRRRCSAAGSSGNAVPQKVTQRIFSAFHSLQNRTFSAPNRPKNSPDFPPPGEGADL